MMVPPSEIDGGILRAIKSGNTHILPVLYAARAGRIRLGMIARTTRIPSSILDPIRNPWSTLLLLGDDDHNSTGPAGFEHATRALRWARFIVLHAAGGEQRHYAIARDEAVNHRRALVIETSSEFRTAWLDAINRFAPQSIGLVIRTTDSEPHPRMGAHSGAMIH